MAKQSGIHHKIRIAKEGQRSRMDRLRIKNEEYAKNAIINAVHKELIDVADIKYLYNQIKQMVDCEMKAHEHLFIEECPKYVKIVFIFYSRYLIV